MRTIRYFAGGNTANGFCSRFEDILPEDGERRTFYIKGGPGVGKSTMMRRVGETAEAAGRTVEYFHCSSDPDSLDGISIPELGFSMMDGTAPHVYDPVLPGARDTLLSLGDYLDEAALRPHAREIRALQREISECFRRCYCFLRAAAEASRAAGRGEENPAKVRTLADEWEKSMPLRGGTGSIRRLFGAAYTPKGYIETTQPLGRVATVECPFGLHPTRLMHTAAERAALRGLNVIVLLNPLEPEQIDQVMIPAHGLTYRAGRLGKRAAEGAAEGAGESWVDAERLFDRLASSNDRERGFDRNAYELMLQRGIEQLKAAKTLHDELEKHYAGCMDFIRWQSALERVLACVTEGAYA